MDIILHIGWHKTGTTAIQDFLFENATRLIKRSGIYYPNEGLIFKAHHHLAWALQNKKESPWGQILLTSDGFRDKLTSATQKAKALGCNTIILSSEEFCTLGEQELIMLHASLSKLASRIKIIVYLRRQDLLIESSYNMAVKWWGSRITSSFHDYIGGKEGYPNYSEILSNWAIIFGQQALVVRPFDRKSLDGNDVRIDFCNCAKINHDSLVFKDGHANESLGPLGIEFMRILNHLPMSREVHAGIVSKLLEYERSQNSPNCIFFNPDERKRFMSFYVYGNIKLGDFNFDCHAFQLGPGDAKNSNSSQISLDQFCNLCNITYFGDLLRL